MNKLENYSNTFFVVNDENPTGESIITEIAFSLLNNKLKFEVRKYVME